MTERPTDQPGSDDPGAGPDAVVHLVAWISSAEERDAMQTWLAEEGLEPRTAWSTPSSVSFRLGTQDIGAVDELMRRRYQDISWTLVPPGAPDYVVRYLHVEGPDGRSFRFSDVPSAIPVGSVADELIAQYQENLPGADSPVIVDQLTPSAGHRRMNPDTTLAEEGITEGSRLRVGFESRAG